MEAVLRDGPSALLRMKSRYSRSRAARILHPPFQAARATRCCGQAPASPDPRPAMQRCARPTAKAVELCLRAFARGRALGMKEFRRLEGSRPQCSGRELLFRVEDLVDLKPVHELREPGVAGAVRVAKAEAMAAVLIDVKLRRLFRVVPRLDEPRLAVEQEVVGGEDAGEEENGEAASGLGSRLNHGRKATRVARTARTGSSGWSSHTAQAASAGRKGSGAGGL